ncbi:MAG: transposase [Patescibacteria group bacterium]
MPRRKEQFVNGEIYHVTVKRVKGLPLFADIDDKYRGVFSIYEFNTTKPVEIFKRRQARTNFKKVQLEGDRVSFIDSRDKLVEVLSFCLMPNHLHLLLRQLKENGITIFMNKLGAGYPAYFRKKHKITDKGYFFQSRFGAVRIETDEQLRVVFTYIHTNPISLIEPKWKEMGIKNPKKAIEFVENYKWSSYQDFIGEENFPSVTEREFLSETMGGAKGCKNAVNDWIKYKGKIKDHTHANLFLE